MEDNLGALVHILHIEEIKSNLANLDESGSDNGFINEMREKEILDQMQRDGMYTMAQRLMW